MVLYRDAFGVPSVFAESDAGAYYGFGYAQAEDHLPELLFLILQAEGRLAEAFGAGCLESDRHFRTLGLGRAARDGLTRLAPDLRREALAPFAAGINAYAARAGAHLPAWTEAALPVTEADLLALFAFFGFTLSTVNDPWGYSTNIALAPWGGRRGSAPPTASNAFALAPRRTASGHPIVGVNPHIHLTHPFLMYEARIKGARIDARGATFYGLPFFILGHTARTAWGVTIHYADTFDRYSLIVNPADPASYLFDGAWRPMEARTETLAVRGGASEPLAVHETVHGPVVARPANGAAVALAWAARRPEGMAEQLYRMNLARDRAGFEAAIALLETPNYGFLFTDAAGELLYAHVGRVGARAERPLVDGRPLGCGPLAVDWVADEATPAAPCPALANSGNRLQAIPGWTSATLARGWLPPAAFPREANPASGWLQMANTPPWVATHPPTVARCGQPELIAPCRDLYPYRQNERGARFADALAGDRRLTLAEAAEVFLDQRVTAADYPLPPGEDTCVDGMLPEATPRGLRCGYLPRLLASWKALEPGLTPARRARLAPAVALLADWDGRASRESRAAALFQDYVFALGRPVKSDAERLRGLDLAVSSLLSRHGRIDPRWGEVHEAVRLPSALRRGAAQRAPLGGSWQFLGTLHAAEGPYRPFAGSVAAGEARLDPAEDGRVEVRFGSVYLLVVELAPEGPRALAAGVYGASDDPASPHFFDQGRELFGRERLRPAPFAEADVRAAATRTVRLPGLPP